MSIIGIDLGTSNVNFAKLDTSGEPQILTNRMSETATPSVVYFNPDGSILVGTEAVNAAYADPGRSVSNWKREMDNDNVLFSDGGKQYRAIDIAEIILKKVKTDAEAKTGCPVNECVITVPANYTNLQKQKTIEAGERAGMRVLVTPHEPTAGALGNRIYKMKNCRALTFDLGGGTFDVSIIESVGNIVKVIQTGGIEKLGGTDFNARLEEYFIDEYEVQHDYVPDKDTHAVFYQDLKGRIEQAKISLSSQSQTNVVVMCNGDVLNAIITREKFEELTNDLVDKAIEQTEKTLAEASLTWDDIDVIYPIGGGSMMPVVIDRLEKVSGMKVTSNCEAYCAAALGAALAARIEYSRQNKPTPNGKVALPPLDFYTREILSRSIGVTVVDESGKEVCSEILSKDTVIPSVHMKNYSLVESRQTNVRIEVLQGEEGNPVSECITLGHFELKELPVRNDLQGRIQVEYALDQNGILTASARDSASGINSELKIDYHV